MEHSIPEPADHAARDLGAGVPSPEPEVPEEGCLNSPIPDPSAERQAYFLETRMEQQAQHEQFGTRMICQGIAVMPTSDLPVARNPPYPTRCKRRPDSCRSLWTWLIPMLPYAFLTGPWFLNWTPFSDLLVRTGVYSWLCTGADAVPPEGGDSTVGACLAQQEALSSLFTIASTTTFCCSVLSGLMLDHLGSATCALVGWLMMALGWALLASSSQRFVAYPTALGFLGSSVDAAFFSLITEARRSGRKSSFVVSTLGACRSGAFALPLALRALSIQLGISFPAVCLFIGIIPCVYCIALVILCLPKQMPLLSHFRARQRQGGPPTPFGTPEERAVVVEGLEEQLRQRTSRFRAAREQQTQQNNQKMQKEVQSVPEEPSQLSSGNKWTLPPSQQQHQRQQEQEHPEQLNRNPHAERHETHIPEGMQQQTEQTEPQQQLPRLNEPKLPALHLVARLPQGGPEPPAPTGSFPQLQPATAAADVAAEAANTKAAVAEVVAGKAAVEGAGAAAAASQIEAKAREREAPLLSSSDVFIQQAGVERARQRGASSVFVSNLLSEIRSPRFLLLVPFAFLNVLNVSFYLPSTAYLMPDAYKMNQVTHMFPFAFAPIWGLVADFIGIVPTMIICNLVTLTAHALLLPSSPSPAHQRASAVLSAMRLSFLASQIYCYSNTTFSARNAGTLIGVTWTVAGLGPVAAGAMRAKGMETGAFRQMLGVTVGFAAGNTLLLGVLYYLVRKQPFTSYRQQEDLERREREETARPPGISIASAFLSCNKKRWPCFSRFTRRQEALRRGGPPP